MVPLYCLLSGAKFRIQGKRKIFIKKDNLATLPIQNYDEKCLSTTVTTDPACYYKTSNGRTIIERWFEFVEEVI